MKLLTFAVVAMLPLAATATSVTYVASNFSVTTPDFLPVLYPNALTDGFGSYMFNAAELESCGRVGQHCTQAGFVVQADPRGFAVIPYIQVFVPDSGLSGGYTITETSGYLVNADLGKVGDYSKPGSGLLLVIQAGASPTASPEPASLISAALGILLVLAMSTWLRRSRLAVPPCN
jgi:hypothetical protein